MRTPQIAVAGIANKMPIKPNKIPKTKNRFQISFLQSYLKKGIFEGKQEAQICLSEELMPNDLLPIISSAGTVKPISGPATYQGQGCFSNSIIIVVLLRFR